MAEEKVGGKIVRLLIINDSSDEAEQAVSALRQSGYKLMIERVDKLPALEAALAGMAEENPPNDKQWDLVLAELTAFHALCVPALMEQHGLQIPIIVLAEKATDENVHHAIHAGARDLVVKGQWTHLMLAFERELRMAREHRAYEEAVEALKQMEIRYRAMIEGARAPIGVTDISELKVLEDKLQHLRQRDALTGLYNRPYFLQELNKVIEHAKSGGPPGTLLGLELHGLRGINETLGHAACDQMLLLLTRYLREKVVDPALLARVGGGQFAVLLPGMAGGEANQVKEKMEGIVKAIQSGKAGKGPEYNFTLNLAGIDKNTGDRHKLLRAIYQTHQETGSKQVNKNPPKEKAGEAPASENERQAARTMLEQSDFRLLFQPVINMYGNQRGFYEAMLCVKTKTGDLIPATELRSMAERSGLAGTLDRWLAQHAITALAKLCKQGKQAGTQSDKPTFFISFSNAAINDNTLLPSIQQQLKAGGLNAAQLLFQLDGSLLLKQNNPATMFIRQIKKMGAGVVIDKFDCAVGNQAQLTNLEIDFIKINCLLERGSIDDDETIDMAILRDAISMAKMLKKKIIVNGIENADSLSALWNFGVEYIQGGFLCPAGQEPDYDFDNEHTLDSKQPASTLWQATG